MVVKVCKEFSLALVVKQLQHIEVLVGGVVGHATVCFIVDDSGDFEAVCLIVDDSEDFEAVCFIVDDSGDFEDAQH